MLSASSATVIALTGFELGDFFITPLCERRADFL